MASGDSGSPLSPSRFISGTSVKWAELAKVAAGTMFLAWSVGQSLILSAFAEGWTALIGGLGGFFVDLLDLTLGQFAQTLTAAWLAPLPLLRPLGVFGAPLVVGLVVIGLALWRVT